MDSKLHLRVRWPDGTVLPIIIRADAQGKDIIKMLRFACGPRQELTILYSDVSVSADSSLLSHGIKDGDTIQIIVKVRLRDNKRLIQSLDNIAREAAKISDLHMNRIEASPNAAALFGPELEEETLRTDLPEPTVLPAKQTVLSSKPLPTFWSENGDCETDDDRKATPPQYSTLKEASAFFSSQGRKWMW